MVETLVSFLVTSMLALVPMSGFIMCFCHL